MWFLSRSSSSLSYGQTSRQRNLRLPVTQRGTLNTPSYHPKKAKKSPSTPSTTGSRGSIKESPGNGMLGSLAKTAKGRYMEMIYEAGLKAINKKDVQDQVSSGEDVADYRLACLLLSSKRW
jgi:hypothetical protein